MTEANAVNTLSEPKVKLNVEESQNKKIKDKPYRQLVSKLIYLAVASRPDIAFLVSKLAQYNDKYKHIHWGAAKRVHITIFTRNWCKNQIIMEFVVLLMHITLMI